MKRLELVYLTFIGVVLFIGLTIFVSLALDGLEDLLHL